jgi:transposase
LPEAGVHLRAQRLYQQLDMLQDLRQQARRDLLAESRKHRAHRILRDIPCIGPIRTALLIALVQTPHRFRTKRQLWAYSGLALETRTSGEYRVADGQLLRGKKLRMICGLNANHNRDLKYIFLSAAINASIHPGPFRDFYNRLIEKGLKPSMARLTLARKIAAIVLILWKKEERFEANRLNSQAA